MSYEDKRRRKSARLGLVAVLSLILSILGVTSLASSAPVSAHTGDLTAVYHCQDDGTYLATYVLTTTSVPDGVTGSTSWRIGSTTFEGTPSSGAGMDRGPVSSTGNQTITLGTQVLPGDTTVGPWVYAWTEWSNGTTKGSDGRVDSLPGDCQSSAMTPPTGNGTASMDCSNAVNWRQ